MKSRFTSGLNVFAMVVVAIFLLSGTSAYAQSVSSEPLETVAEEQSRSAEASVNTIVRVVGNRVQRAINSFYNRLSFGTLTQNYDEYPVVGTQDDDSFFNEALFDDAGAWTNGSGEHNRQEPSDLTSSSTLLVGVSGADKFVTDNILVGGALSVSYTSAEIEQVLANGFSPFSDVNSRSYGLTAYGAYLLSDNVYFDVLAGVTTDNYNTRTFTLPGATVSDYDQTGWTRYGAINGYLITPIMDTLTMTHQLGFQRSVAFVDDSQDPLSVAPFNIVPSTQSSLSVYTLGTRADYILRDDVGLYGGAAVELFGNREVIGLGEGIAGVSGTDLQTKQHWQTRFTFGANVFSGDHMTLSAEGGFVAFRQDTENWTFGLNARYDF